MVQPARYDHDLKLPPTEPLRDSTFPEKIAVRQLSTLELVSLLDRMSVPISNPALTHLGTVLDHRCPLDPQLSHFIGSASVQADFLTIVSKSSCHLTSSISFTVLDSSAPPLTVVATRPRGGLDRTCFDVVIACDTAAVTSKGEAEIMWSLLDFASERLGQAFPETDPACSGSRVTYSAAPMPSFSRNDPLDDFHDWHVSFDHEPTTQRAFFPYALVISGISNDAIRTVVSAAGLSLVAERLTDDLLEYIRLYCAGTVPYDPVPLYKACPTCPQNLRVRARSKVQSSDVECPRSEPETDPSTFSFLLDGGHEREVSLEFGELSARYDEDHIKELRPARFYVRFGWNTNGDETEEARRSIATIIGNIRRRLSIHVAVPDDCLMHGLIEEPAPRSDFDRYHHPLGQIDFTVLRRPVAKNAPK